jgi:dTDP-4-amino-4,6-dideoxy-D-galactose acyltransferase
MQAPLATAFRLLDWDSSHFGLRIARVMPSKPDEELFREALSWADLASIDCMYLLVDSDDATAIRLANHFGWRIVDLRVTLAARLSDVAPGAAGIRYANTEDISYLRQLAERSHRDSRFYADGNFPAAACDELFAKWIDRSVRDRDFAGSVLVPQIEANRPAGYITCAVKEGVGQIGLIAVDENFRKMGVGGRLLAESSRWFAKQGVERVSVVTQGRNIPALRMYQRYGFSIESIHLWFHWWRNTAGGR